MLAAAGPGEVAPNNPVLGAGKPEGELAGALLAAAVLGVKPKLVDPVLASGAGSSAVVLGPGDCVPKAGAALLPKLNAADEAPVF